MPSPTCDRFVGLAFAFMPMATVGILLATWNGYDYLDEFLSSIHSQTYGEWHVWARDDSSHDQTLELLFAWQKRLGPGRLTIVDPDMPARLGTAGNFGRLLEVCNADYVMLADQDDVWLPVKIELTLAAMRRLEQRVGKDRPCLVSTDAIICGQDLCVRHSSFWRYQSLRPLRFPWLGRYLVNNTAQGCTMMLNRHLADLVGSVPSSCAYADWYIGIVAAAFGHIDALPVPTIYWRRHDAATTYTSSVLAEIAQTFMRPLSVRARVNRFYDVATTHARAFAIQYSSRLSERDRNVLNAFLGLRELNWALRLLTIVRFGLFFTSARRTVGFGLFL